MGSFFSMARSVRASTTDLSMPASITNVGTSLYLSKHRETNFNKFCTSKNGCEIRFLKNKIAENSITRKIPKDHQPVHVFDPNTFTFLGDQGPWDGTKTLSLTPSILPNRQRQLGAIPVATLRVQLQEDGRLSDTAHEFVNCFLGWARSSVAGRIPADYVQLGEDFLV